MVETSKVVHVIFHRKISKKNRKITRTIENYAYENYVHGTVLIFNDIKTIRSTRNSAKLAKFRLIQSRLDFWYVRIFTL